MDCRHKHNKPKGNTMTTHKKNKSQNTAIRSAHKKKDNEFYTPRETVEAELPHYEDEFRGKSILCNCDDPTKSEFFQYFKDQFNELKLKRLVAVRYSGSKVGDPAGSPHYKVITPSTKRKYEMKIVPLKGDNKHLAGDFRSPECLKLMDKADIVVTNPPFSLFHDLVGEVLARGKKFLIIGNILAPANQRFFPLS